MNLTISMLAASVIIRFTTPGPGSYCLLSTSGDGHYLVEASGHEKVAVHVCAEIDLLNPHRCFFVQFYPDQR